ncbi:protein-export chaperone SecB [Hymenobacter sp. APR13]|uniref:protein-export chaperone SecB n=1 Tax=Hymenobacter sp. APR13 TaxID=1356852 RepID=UPI0004E08B24|nr:protein-export chaperone SecB [Hymenobacter sp. APR13]AII53814.1 hypothetical protein N008_17755 [Hymenobacter sp. APR13]
MDQPIARFSLQGIQVKESYFTQSAEASGQDFAVDTEVEGIVNEATRTFQLHLRVRVSDEQESFEARIHQVGNFVFDRDIEEKVLTNFFVINAPAMLFPFVRSYIASLTALSGYETILLPALNLQSLGESLRDNIKYEQTEQDDQPATE